MNQQANSRVSISSLHEQWRISQEEIIIKDESQKQLISSIICPICLLTLPLPYYQCQQCNNSFCPNCIEDWWNKQSEIAQKQCIFKCQKPSFKKVKRSNTFAALLQTLQFKCGLCQGNYKLAAYHNHKAKMCPQTQFKCINQGCEQIFKRKNQLQHLSICLYRQEKCKYCESFFKCLNLQEHQSKFCHSRLIDCLNQGCKKPILLIDIQNHTQKCDYKILVCQWCKKQIIQKQWLNHQQICEQKLIICQWCNQKMNQNKFNYHQCQYQQQICKLCQKSILLIQMRFHKQQCMFENMLKLKEQNLAILQENKKLHYKINELQQIIEDTMANSEGKTLEVMKKFKQNEKKQLQKDLLRIQNSLNSINKLRDQETSKHESKFKHFFSFCPQCKVLEKRFAQMKQPLIKKQKQVYEKIAEIKKFQETAKG